MSDTDLMVVSYNVNGYSNIVNDNSFVSKILYPAFSSSPDIVCLQESHCVSSNEKIVLSKCQYDAAFANNSTATGGLITLFRRNLNYIVHAHHEFKVDSSRSAQHKSQCLLVHCTVQEVEMVIVNVYLHPNTNSDSRRKFLAKIGEEVTQYGCPNVICCGDFNTPLSLQKDSTSGASHHEILVKTFNEFIELMEWGDSFRILNPTARRMTHFAGHRRAGARIDYVFVSGYFVNALSDAAVVPRLRSDHNPISIHLNLNRNPKGPGYWKFPDPILKNEEFCKNLKQKLIDWLKQFNQEFEPDSLIDLIKWKVQGATREFLRLDGLEDKIKNEMYEAKLAELYHYRDSQGVSWTQRNIANAEIVTKTQEWIVFLDRVGEKRKEFNIGRCIRGKRKVVKIFLS